jgi:hypothetical protein
MKCEEIADVELMAEIGQSTGPRTRGVGIVHLSDIYKILMQRLQPKRFSNERPMDMTRVQVGLLFESMLEEALIRRFSVSRPGEVVSDEGIYMSPDGVNPTLLAGEEYKATYISSAKGITDEDGQPLDKFVHWFVQMKGYAKWLGVTRFILRVLFLAGDYSFPIGPQFKSWDITFTDEEIDENWTMLRNIGVEEGLITYDATSNEYRTAA